MVKGHHRRARPKGPEVVHNFAPVVEADRVQLGALGIWANRYVNHVYANGGLRGEPIRKIWNEALYWQRQGDNGSRLLVSAKGLMRVHCPPVDAGDAAYKEYKRQQVLGTEIDIEQTTYPHPHKRGNAERIELHIDADDIIIGGSYRWYGAVESDQPAPTGPFASLDEAQALRVTARAVLLVNDFRNLSLSEGVEGNVTGSGFYNYAALHLPEALIPIPDFV